MSQGVTSRTEATVVARVAESCPKAREFPEQLLVLLGLTALVLALAAWAHAVGPQDGLASSSRPLSVETSSR